MNSPNNGHFGARPTVRYSGGVLYWGIILCDHISRSLFQVPHIKAIAKGPREYVSRIRVFSGQRTHIAIHFLDHEYRTGLP